jgi:hypothetical protein
MTRLLLLALSLVMALPVAASERLEKDEVLDMLQRIQGRWRSECRPVDSGAHYGYQQTRLVVSFTHFTFSTIEYANAQCLTERSRWQAKYRFVLGGSLLTGDGKVAFAIDFSASEGPAPAGTLYPLNLVHYQSGVLRLGLAPANPSQERLQQLDYSLAFAR